MTKAQLFGRPYIVDYLTAEIRKQKEVETYRIYVADSLYCLSHNLAFQKKYSEIINPKPERSGDEIAADFIKRMKGGKSK